MPDVNVGDTVTVGDVNMKVEDDAACERSSFVVCIRVADMPKSNNEDSQESACVECDSVVHRDSLGPQSPPSLCFQCFCKRTGMSVNDFAKRMGI